MPDRGLALPDDIRERLGATRYGLIKLWARDVSGALDAAVAPYVTPACSVLDAGCSRGDPDLPTLTQAGLLVGCDADRKGLLANTLTARRVEAGLDRLPFRSRAFDVVVCKFVVEHLAEPANVFREFWRVLRPGGVVALLTPNRWSTFATVARCVPFRAKRLMKRMLFGGYEEDTFPAVYRANTRTRLDAAMQEAGFQPGHVEMLPGMWAFFIFWRPMALGVRALEHVVARVPVLRLAATYILGVWTKTSDNADDAHLCSGVAAASAG